MIRITRLLPFLAAALLLLPCISAGAEKPSPSFNGALFRSLFTNEPFQVSGLDSAAFAALPDSLRKRVATYAERREKFVSKIQTPNPPSGFELGALLNNRRMVERGIYSLSSRPDAGKEAFFYARDAQLYYEWEGQSSGPLTEAEYAESSLDSPVLKPYLLLFIMHRYRCAYECLIMEKDTAGAQKASEKYRKYLKLARAYPDPLVKLIAEDMDRIPGNIYNDSRYTGGDVHP